MNEENQLVAQSFAFLCILDCDYLLSLNRVEMLDQLCAIAEVVVQKSVNQNLNVGLPHTQNDRNHRVRPSWFPLVNALCRTSVNLLLGCEFDF